MKFLLKTIFCLFGMAQFVLAENEKFELSGDTLFYSTEIEGLKDDYISMDDVKIFREILYQNSGINKINLDSYGGSMGAGLEIGRIIQDFHVETIVTKECSSACTFIFLGGQSRTLAPGALLGFHRPGWDLEAMSSYYERNKSDFGWKNEISFASWVQSDTFYEAGRIFQAFDEAGVDVFFINQTLRFSDEQMWYPSRSDLIGFGVLPLSDHEKLAAKRPLARPILEPGAEASGSIELSSLETK
jgi:ATP-dependent protease ClpP protease subunit